MSKTMQMNIPAEGGLGVVVQADPARLFRGRDPLAAGTRELVAHVDAIIRPMLEKVQGGEELEGVVDELLFNDELIAYFLQLEAWVTIASLEGLARARSPAEGLESLVGRLLAEKVGRFLRATALVAAKALVVNATRASEPAGTVEGAGFSPTILAQPSLYMAEGGFRRR